MAPTSLLGLLQRAAENPADRGISVYFPKDIDKVGKRLTYNELLQLALQNASRLRHLPSLTARSVFLLHFDNHLDGIEYLWSVIAAGYLPAISPPLTNDAEQRKKHMLHLDTLLHHPVILTREHLLADFGDMKDKLQIVTIESLKSRNGFHDSVQLPQKGGEDLAALMLTSGSTGNAKAVELRHVQILNAVKGKSTFHGTHSDDTFLNWIGLDHVANLTEVHLHAMSLAAEQVHVSAIDLLSDPVNFMRLVSRHKAAYSFAPNFFLASLRKALEKSTPTDAANIDLSSLRALISGGEANVTETSDGITKLLGNYSAPHTFLRPGFGMTETCAGSIYNNDCPAYDKVMRLEFTSLGQCVPGIAMRVVKEDGSIARANQVGDLHIHGPVVFKAYYNNHSATEQAFTTDGWYVTGDRAYLDAAGNLNLAGRAKESIIINGVKYFPHEIESAIEDANIEGVVPSFTAAFPHRPQGSPTEVLCVVYLPSYLPDDVKSRMETRGAISEVAVRYCGTRPYRILPLTKEALPKTSLGKLSRAKIRTAFENGAYAAVEQQDQTLIKAWQEVACQKATNKLEQTILDAFVETLEISEEFVGIDSNFFELGVTSVEILTLKTAVEKAANLKTPLSITALMANPSIRLLAAHIEKSADGKYKPSVTLQGRGAGTPLWLIHPGVGEILIFFRLASHFTDRPVYALRSKGFDGEGFFQSMEECLNSYYDEIKAVQPEGPYAIAGYSYGATLAFEISKLMTKRGDDLKFLGAIDQPPLIQGRMNYSNWTNVVLTLAKFVEIIDDEQGKALYPEMCKLSQDEVLDHILSLTTPTHLETYAIDKPKLANWAELALNNHRIARGYEPSGQAPLLDIFHAGTPDVFYAKTAAEMREKHLYKWNEFSETNVVFHEVPGTHNDMIRGNNVPPFYRTLKAAMQERGV